MAITYCPSCGNFLQVEMVEEGLRCSCPTCPYVYKMTKTMSQPARLVKKEVEDVRSDQDFSSASQCEAQCEKCQNNRAFFKEIQMRSADEPATVFYQCTKCPNRWKED
eukprot:jgi/Astpho2/6409/e_gw1.00093.27.1_t